MTPEEILSNPNRSRSYIGKTVAVSDYLNQEPWAPRDPHEMARNVAFAMARRAGDAVDRDTWTTETAQLVRTTNEVRNTEASRGDEYYPHEIYMWIERED